MTTRSSTIFSGNHVLKKLDPENKGWRGRQEKAARAIESSPARDEALKAIQRAFARDKRGDRDAVIYVHGFNNTFSEGLYRIAQLSKDLDMPGVTAHYSWPSAGNPLGYVADRDSSLFARDGLERLMQEVVASGAERIVLVAHSMGSALTMEALRQIATGNRG